MAQELTGPAEGEALRRLMELVRRLQARVHKEGLMFQPERSGHRGDLATPDMGIPTCPHPDCVLALAPLSGPKKEHDDEDDSRVGRQCAVRHHPTAKEPRLRAVGR